MWEVRCIIHHARVDVGVGRMISLCCDAAAVMVVARSDRGNLAVVVMRNSVIAMALLIC